MTMTGVRSLAGKALVMGALGLGALGSAQATLVVGVWDPVYDAVNFPNLGWRGTIQADVPAACLAQGGPADYATVGLCSPTTILDAKIEFYDTTAISPEPTLETLDFTAALPGVTNVGILSPGVLIGLRTGTSSAVTASVTTLAQYLGVFADFTLDLDFTLGGPSVTLAWSIDPNVCLANALPAASCSGVNQVEPTITYFVPEPVGLALAGTGLLALATVRRRRRG